MRSLLNHGASEQAGVLIQRKFWSPYQQKKLDGHRRAFSIFSVVSSPLLSLIRMTRSAPVEGTQSAVLVQTDLLE